MPNYEKTRWFLVLRVGRPDGNGLNQLLQVCNEAVEEFSQPPLYASPRISSKTQRRVKECDARSSNSMKMQGKEVEDFSAAFHISIGWALEDYHAKCTERLKTIASDKMFESIKGISINVNAIKVKVGNVVTSIYLIAKAVEGKGLFG